MVIDKTFGDWDFTYSSILDDYAYSLFLKNCSFDVIPLEQYNFKYLYEESYYYSKANLILRKEKIEKIKRKHE